jgi:WD40 repeat protein
MASRIVRILAKLGLILLILGALASVIRDLAIPPPVLPARFTLDDSAGYQLAGFAPDGRTFVGIWLHTNEDRSTCWAGPLRLWDTTTGRVRATVGRNVDRYWPPLRFSPDGRYMTIEGPGVLRAWEVETGREVAAPDLGKNQYHFDANFAFATDGQTLAVGSVGTRSVNLLDLATGKVRASLPGVYPPLRFAPDGSTLVAASDDGVALVDWMAVRTKVLLPGEGSRVRCLAFAPDGKSLAAGTAHGMAEAAPDEVRLWNLAAGTPATVLVPPQPLQALRFSSDGAILQGWDHGLKLLVAWDLSCTPPRQLLTTLPAALWQPAPDGKTLVGRDGDGVAVWDVRAGKERDYFRACAGNGIPLLISPDGRHFAVPGQLERSGGWLSFGPGPSPPAASVVSVDPSTNVTQLLDATTGRVQATLEQAFVAEFSPDSRLLAAPSWGRGPIRLWDVPPADRYPGLTGTLAALFGLFGVALGWWVVGRFRKAGAPRADVSRPEQDSGRET